MKKNILLFIIIQVIAFNLFSQNTTYYYSEGKRIAINEYKRKIFIRTNSLFLNNSAQEIGVKPFNLIEDKWAKDNNQVYNWSELEFSDSLTDFEIIQTINNLRNNIGIEYISPSIITPTNKIIGLSNYFYIKLKQSSDTSLLNSFSIQFNLNIVRAVKNMPLWYILSCTKNTTHNPIELTNIFYESSLFEDVDPGFRFSFVTSCDLPPNDQNFSDQWGLDNYAFPDLDINACEAWDLATGEGIKVAIVDEGFIIDSHDDLTENITSLHYDTETGGTASSVYYGDHGFFSGGIVAAKKDNNFQITGIAPNSKLINVSNAFDGEYPDNTTLVEMSEGISWAYFVAEADIINCSWGSAAMGVTSSLLNNSINNALSNGRNGLGSVVVFSTGNQNQGVFYPAQTNPKILAVGNMQQNGTRFSSSNYGPELDLIAPGTDIISLLPGNGSGYKTGSSFAAPLVSGTAALMLEVNPCLSSYQVNTIIEKTTQKVSGINTYSNLSNYPNGTWNNGKGYGLLDAFASVNEAKNMYSSTLDLFMRDRLNDYGYDAGYNFTYDIDESPDIWVRNATDGLSIQIHENPIYSSSNPVYVYVRVGNKSCVPSTGNEQLKLYWTKASSISSWPQNWDGTDPTVGNLIGTINLPILSPGTTQIFRFDWNIVNPEIFDNWNSCLLARIENSTDDPITVYPNDFAQDIYMNNNIALRNSQVILPGHGVTVINDREVIPSGTNVLVGNPYDIVGNYDVVFMCSEFDNDKRITDDAEITVQFDEVGWNLFKPLFANRNDIRINESRKLIKLLNNKVAFENIRFPAFVRVPIYVGFSFFAETEIDSLNYRFHVLQKRSRIDSLTNEKWTGGVHFKIIKENRSDFQADAGPDMKIRLGDSISLNTSLISEPAIYNWYNQKDSLLFTGNDTIIFPNSSGKYILEVTSALDGAKDYDEFEVEVQKNYIANVFPNPSSDVINISFSTEENASSNIVIIGGNNSSVLFNQNIENEMTNLNVNISEFQNGFYTIVLFCNGQIVDDHLLIVE